MVFYKIYNKENNKKLTKKEFRQRFGEKANSILGEANTHFKSHFSDYEISGTELIIQDCSRDAFFSSCKIILTLELFVAAIAILVISSAGYQDISAIAHKVTMVGGGINMFFAAFAYMLLAMPNEDTDWQSLSHIAIIVGAGLLFASKLFLGA